MLLVLAVEDKIGQREQRASVFRIALAAADAGFRFGRILMREDACLLQRTGFVHERKKAFRSDADEFFFFQDTSDKLARFAVAVFHGVNKRQRNFPFLQIAHYRFAELLRGSGEIEQVVHELERKASVGSIVSKRFFLFAFESAEDCSEACASAEETCGFVRCKF